MANKPDPGARVPGKAYPDTDLRAWQRRVFGGKPEPEKTEKGETNVE